MCSGYATPPRFSTALHESAPFCACVDGYSLFQHYIYFNRNWFLCRALPPPYPFSFLQSHLSPLLSQRRLSHPPLRQVLNYGCPSPGFLVWLLSGRMQRLLPHLFIFGFLASCHVMTAECHSSRACAKSFMFGCKAQRKGSFSHAKMPFDCWYIFIHSRR